MDSMCPRCGMWCEAWEVEGDELRMLCPMWHRYTRQLEPLGPMMVKVVHPEIGRCAGVPWHGGEHRTLVWHEEGTPEAKRATAADMCGACCDDWHRSKASFAKETKPYFHALPCPRCGEKPRDGL